MGGFSHKSRLIIATLEETYEGGAEEGNVVDSRRRRGRGREGEREGGREGEREREGGRLQASGVD